MPNYDPTGIGQQLGEITLLLAMVQRIVADIKVPPYVYEPEQDKPRYKTQPGKIRKDSPRLETNIRQHAKRHPEQPYDEIASLYNITVNKVAELLGDYKTAKEIRDAKAKAVS